MINTDRMFRYLVERDDLHRWVGGPYVTTHDTAVALCSYYTGRVNADTIEGYFLRESMRSDVNWNRLASLIRIVVNG